MQKLLYVVFENLASHKGLAKKFNAQMSAFKNHCKVKHFVRNCNGGFLFKVLDRLFTELKYCMEIIFFKKSLIFYRYNYSAVLFNVILLLKRKSTLILEVNTNNKKEAQLLNNRIRILLNSMFELSLSKRAYKIVSYGYPLSDNVIEKYEKKVKIILNGLNDSCLNDNIGTVKIEGIKEFREKYKLIALFYGYFVPWHGLDRIVNIIKNNKETGLIIVGTGDKNQLDIVKQGAKEENIIYLGYCDKSTIESIINYTDFAFASMAYDRLGLDYASPLKVAEYLRYGLPIVMNFKVNGLTGKVNYLHEYINDEGFQDFCKRVKGIDKENIVKDFHYFFNWDRIVKEDILGIDER